jgi:hypothetical protein
MEAISFTIRPPLTRADLPGLYRRVCLLLATSGARTARCHVAAVAPDAVAVDALARLKLAAIRHRVALEILGASPELRELIALTGLQEALSPRAAEGVRTAGTADRSTGST